MSTPALDEFTRAYCETMLWSENDLDTGAPLDHDHGIADIDPDTLADIIADCAAFQRDNAAHLHPDNCLKYGPDFGPAGRAGHDYWLTRNGHGAGYWDGAWAEPAASALTEAAKRAGCRTPYVADGRVVLANG